MIVGSIVLVLVAVVLLVLGLTRQVDLFYYSSIAASALAAMALLVGVRQIPGGRVPEADFDVRSPGARPAPWPNPMGRAGVPRQSRLGAVDPAESVSAEVPAIPRVRDEVQREDGAELITADQAELEDRDGEVPPDEPDEQPMTYQEAVALGRISAEVLVIDGRPRFHVADCLHLLGRTVQPVTVREAAVLGFTPCALCDPVSRLINNP